MLDSYYKSGINVQKYCNSIIAFNQSLELSLNNNSPFRSKRCHLINCDCEIFVVSVSTVAPDTNWAARSLYAVTFRAGSEKRVNGRKGKGKLKSNRSLHILLFCRNTERDACG